MLGIPKPSSGIGLYAIAALVIGVVAGFAYYGSTNSTGTLAGSSGDPSGDSSS